MLVEIWHVAGERDDWSTRLVVTLLYLVCGTPCGQIAAVMSLCHSVLCGLGGKCVCVSPRHSGTETCWCKFGVSWGRAMIGGVHEA